MSRIDELEQTDRRFDRKHDGQLKSGFRSNAEMPADRAREFKGYLAKLQEDSARWQKEGDLVAGDRARVQLEFERADKASTDASRQRDRTSDPAEKQQHDRSMRSADKNVDAVQAMQNAADTTDGSKWHLKRQQDLQRQRETARAERAAQEKAEFDERPLAQRLTGDDKMMYEARREVYGKLMSRSGDYLNDESRSADFDRRYEAHLADQARAKDSDQRKPQAANTAQARNERAGKKAVQTSEAHGADEKSKTAQPLRREYAGYKAEEAEDKSLTYVNQRTRAVAFVDRGNRVSMPSDLHSRDPEANRLALQHASEKFTRLRLSGSQEFRESSARLATRMGLADRISNPELAEVVREEREQMARESATKVVEKARAPDARVRAQPEPERMTTHQSQGQTRDFASHAASALKTQDMGRSEPATELSASGDARLETMNRHTPAVEETSHSSELERPPWLDATNAQTTADAATTTVSTPSLEAPITVEPRQPSTGTSARAMAPGPR